MGLGADFFLVAMVTSAPLRGLLNIFCVVRSLLS